jgi:hypothetical protein
MMDNMNSLTKNEYDFLADWMLASGAKMYPGLYERSSIILEASPDEYYLVQANGRYYLAQDKAS